MAVSRWLLVVRQCFFHRTSGDEFGDLLILMYERSKISGAALVQILLKCESSFCAPNDPLIPIYTQKVITLGLADVSDLLIVLIKEWNELAKLKEDRDDDCKTMESAARLINSLIGMIASGSFAISPKEARRSLVLCSRWLFSVATWIPRDPSRSNEPTGMALVESCAMLLVTIVSTTMGITILHEVKSANAVEDVELVSSIQKAILSSFPLLPAASQSLHLQLQALLRHVSQSPASGTNDASASEAIQFQGGVFDGPLLASRASWYLYLDSLRCRCATIDDSYLLSFLNARHSTDHASMFSDLTIASFDVLQQSHLQERDRQSIDRWCSFIVSKLPALLSVISVSSFGSFSIEQALKHGLQFVNIDSSSPYLTTNLTVIKAKFVQACASYRLIPHSNVSNFVAIPQLDLNQSPVLYGKDDLVSQMKSSHSNGTKILRDMDNLDGNASNIANAIVELIHGYCQSRETLPLKELAAVMLRKPELIDTISVHAQIGYFLRPLCRLLDEWTWDDLHGEGQPLYEEFGTIMLLIMAFIYRLSLAESDVVPASNSSFVLSFLQDNKDESYLDSMTEEVKHHLGEWINALFIAEGLSDEVMSSCSPQDFYRLVPVLLSQSLTACESGKLSIDTLKAGFEYLLEPFLLPSLIPAITWLMSPSAARYNQQYVQKLLETLLREPGSSDAREIHRTILGIVAAKAGVSVGANASSQSSIGALAKHLGFASNVSADIQEVKSWSAMPGGIMSQVDQAVHALISWASADANLLNPPSSGYVQLAAAIDVQDGKHVFKPLSTTLLGYRNSIDYASALDLIATMVICLDEGSSTRRLADVLTFEQQNLLPLLRRKETLLAEEIVRLSRRVELLSTVVTQTHIPLDDVVTSLMPELTEAEMHNVQAFPEQSGDMSTTQEDVPQDIDQMLDAAAAMGNIGQDNNNLSGNMNDMYLDLDSGDMDLVNFDDLDMEGMF